VCGEAVQQRQRQRAWQVWQGGAHVCSEKVECCRDARKYYGYGDSERRKGACARYAIVSRRSALYGNQIEIEE